MNRSAQHSFPSPAQELQDAAADAAAEAEEAAASNLAEAKERVQARGRAALAANPAFPVLLRFPTYLQPALVKHASHTHATHLLQVAVAAAVAEKDAQLHAAQEALKRQLQQQLQRAEAEMEVGGWAPCALAT